MTPGRRLLIRSRPLAPVFAAVAATLVVCAIAIVALFLLRRWTGVSVPAAAARSIQPTARSYTPPAPPPVRTTVFSDVRVIDVMSGTVGAPQDVLVGGGRIAAIATRIEAPGDSLVIPATGKFLMPGLIDTHVHVTADDQLILFLAAGVTTVQGLGGPRARNLDARQRQRRGELAAPDYVSCDTVIPGGAPGTAAEKVRAAIDDGAECLKIYSPPDWTVEEHRALVLEAKAHGLRIGGHLPRNLSLEEGLGSGQEFVAHAEEFLYAYFNKKPRREPSHIGPAVDITRHSGTIVIPTLVAYKAIVDQVGPKISALLEKPELTHVEPAVLESWRPPHNRYRQRFTVADVAPLAESFLYQQWFVHALERAGVPLALGTDSSPQMPFVIPGFSAIDEARELHRAGLSNAAVLRVATSGGAQLVKRSDHIGRIAVGMDADLLLLEGNPLVAIDNLARRTGVMAKGRWMTEAWLKGHLPVYARSSRR